MKEEWKEIKGHEGRYEISSFGRIRSVSRMCHNGNGMRKVKGKILTLYTNCAYPSYGWRMSPHRLVVEHFIGKITKGLEVNHKDGNKHNNRVTNLEIVSKSENEKHKYHTLGYKIHNLKLTKEIASEIRKKYKTKKYSYPDLAKEYGVSHMTIGRIIRRAQISYL